MKWRRRRREAYMERVAQRQRRLMLDPMRGEDSGDAELDAAAGALDLE